jgi:hypothetical protein
VIFWKRLQKKWKIILIDLLSGVGLFWLFVEMSSYFTNGNVDIFLKTPFIYFCTLFLILVAVIIKNKPKTTFKERIRGKDNFIEIRVGDAFENNGALIIPFNNQFDTRLSGNVKKADSLQNKLIQDYYSGKSEHLDIDIEKQNIDFSKKYEIGKTIEIENNGKRFYLLVNSHKLENCRVEASIDDLIISLSGVWDFLANDTSRNKIVTIPLLNTGHGRGPALTKMKIVKDIIHSYIEESKTINICEKLIISILETDIDKKLIDLDELEEYLKARTKFFRTVKTSQDDDGSSKVVDIES